MRLVTPFVQLLTLTLLLGLVLRNPPVWPINVMMMLLLLVPQSAVLARVRSFTFFQIQLNPLDRMPCRPATCETRSMGEVVPPIALRDTRSG